MRPVRTHHWAGVGGCLKNYIMFVEEPSDYHPDSCADLGAIWNLPIVKGKTRLNVLLALTPQFYGRGPHASTPGMSGPTAGLFVSKDPVAVDALGAELLRLKRLEFFGEDKPVTPCDAHPAGGNASRRRRGRPQAHRPAENRVG